MSRLIALLTALSLAGSLSACVSTAVAVAGNEDVQDMAFDGLDTLLDF